MRYAELLSVKGSWAVGRGRCESPSLTGGSAPGSGGVECGRVDWNARCSGGMCRYREENQWRR